MKFLKRALEITGAFEGKGFGQVTGNFDGMGMSVGVLQWNYGTGSLQSKILKPFIDAYGSKTLDSFFPVSVSVTANMSPNTAVSYAKTHMLSGTSVKSDWSKAWSKFLTDERTIGIQTKGAESIGQKAESLCKSWGLNSERAFCWMFDVVTQNGSLKTVTKPKPTQYSIQDAMDYSKANGNRWQELELTEEQEILLVASKERASLSNSQWRQDVMDRKGTIACGTGVVHGKTWDFKFDDEIKVKEPIDEKPVEKSFWEIIVEFLISLFSGGKAKSEKTTKDILSDLAPTLNPRAIDLALAYYDKVKSQIKNHRYWTIVDFDKHSSEKRLWVFDLEAKRLIKYIEAAHGSGSDGNNDGIADSFGNVSGSNKSSLGPYVTAESYGKMDGGWSKFDYAVILHGLDKALNGNAYARAIRFHSSSYVTDKEGDRTGRSLGCIATSIDSARELRSILAGGTYFFCYHASLESPKG